MISGIFFGLAMIFLLPAPTASQQTQRILPAEVFDSGEKQGTPPYEMIWAQRKPDYSPLISFDSLEDWQIVFDETTDGSLRPSLEQQLWGSPVARLAYRSDSPNGSLLIRPPEAVPIPAHATGVTLWVFGNNWGWDPDPSTPPVDLTLLIETSGHQIEELPICRVRWKEWWLVHKVLPADLLSKGPFSFAGLRVDGISNPESRTLYFENLTFFKEQLEPLVFSSRPKRGIAMFPGQSTGANTGPGRLPFPNRETTILPENLESEFTTQMLHNRENGRFRFIYKGRDVVIEYCLKPDDTFWGPVAVKMNRFVVANALVDAAPEFPPALQNYSLSRSWREGDIAWAEWKGEIDGREIIVTSSIQLWQKSLVVDVFCPTGTATGLSFGRLADVREPELVTLPFMNYGGHHLRVLLSRGVRPFFASVWMDWYRSNASKPFAHDRIEGASAWLNGGVHYLPKTNGERNPLFERFFVTFSPVFEEVLASIPNPPARDGKIAGKRLWQESWGPQDYGKEMARSRRLRAYGISELTQCNHEITWRDGGESFTFRTRAAPGKGGDQALKDYVSHQKSLGWRSGLYTNYTDFAPVNRFWDTDRVMRDPKGDLITAWPRCYSPKALFAVEMDRILAPRIKSKFGSNAAYTDVHTAVAPWDRTDYDARVPGAGTFTATFYAYGEILLNDQRVYDSHCWSEGNHQWLYAGLATGNYALTYSDLDYRTYPYLPHFDLLKIHPLSVDIGMPWTARFFRNADHWDSEENITASIDRFLAATIAYGHIGWLVEEGHGIRQTARSYYMMQQLQSRYVMEKPEAILYGSSEGLIESSQALLDGSWKDSKIYIRYPNGLEIWVNGYPDSTWAVQAPSGLYTLPPFGWVAVQPDDFFEASALSQGHRYDEVASPEYIFLDGRGVFRRNSGIGFSGSLAVRKLQTGGGLSITLVEGIGNIEIGETGSEHLFDDVRTEITRVARARSIRVKAFDLEGRECPAPKTSREDTRWIIQPTAGAVRYAIDCTEAALDE